MMIVLIPLFGLALGILLGLIIPWQIPFLYGRYSVLLIIAVMDAILRGLSALRREDFSFSRFWGGLFAAAGLGVLLVWLGDRLGVDLYLGVVVVLCLRLFKHGDRYSV